MDRWFVRLAKCLPAGDRSVRRWPVRYVASIPVCLTAMPPMTVRAAAYPATQGKLVAKAVALFAVHLAASLSFPTIGEMSGLRARDDRCEMYSVCA